MTPRGRRSGARRGQSLVEFALVAPIFFLMVIGLLDAGYAVYSHNTVANAARSAARVAIVNQSSSAVEAEARRHTVALGDDRVTVTQASCGTVGCTYTVTVTYDYQPVTPLIGRIFNPIITSTAAMPVEYENP